MKREDVFTETLMKLAEKMNYKTSLIGRNLYVKLPETAKRFKIYLKGFNGVYGNIDGFMCIAINKNNGEIDRCDFRFCDYFDKVCYYTDAPEQTPYINETRWYSELPCCLPKESDFQRIAEAIDEYIEIMK